MPHATYFDGVAVKDPALAALLRSAEAQGFRLEEATNGGHQRQTGLVAYPPDSEQSPVRFGTAEVHPKHIANIRANLRRAGFIDPEQQATTTPEETDMARGKSNPKQDHKHPSSFQETLDALPAEERPQLVGHVAASSVSHIGAGPHIGALVGVLVETLAEWAIDPQIKAAMIEDLGGGSKEQVDEALAMAAEAEARAVRAEAAADKAQEREIAAREDCKAALERAKQAEARAEALDAALRPLRAILQTGGAA